MDNGWIKIHRKMIEWEWYKEPATFSVFFYLLLSANHQDKKWMGIEIKSGQLITSVNSIFNGLNRNSNTGKLNRKANRVTRQCIRTALKRLESTNELTIKTTNKYSLVTINKWYEYQLTNNQTNKQLTNNQQTTNNKQEGKNVKNVKNNIKKKIQKEKFSDYGSHVKLTETQYSKLCQDYSLDIIRKKIDTMNEHLGMHGKKGYADYNLAIRNWLRREGVQKQFSFKGIPDGELAAILKTRPDLHTQAEKERPTALHISKFI